MRRVLARAQTNSRKRQRQLRAVRNETCTESVSWYQAWLVSLVHTKSARN